MPINSVDICLLENCIFDDDEDFKEDGSIWTSYSDLFTTVAVIFLVMFVFALIKAGVSNMKQVVEKRKHDAVMQGRISKKDKLKTAKKISKVNNTIAEMTAYEDLVSKKMQEMNQFVKKLQENKNVMKELINDQTKKDMLLALVNKKIMAAQDEVKLSKTENEKLMAEIEKKKKYLEQTTIERGKLQKYKQNVDQKVAQYTDLIENLQSENGQLKQTGQSLKTENGKQQQQIQNFVAETSQLQQQNSTLTNKVSSDFKNK